MTCFSSTIRVCFSVLLETLKVVCTRLIKALVGIFLRCCVELRRIRCVVESRLLERAPGPTAARETRAVSSTCSPGPLRASEVRRRKTYSRLSKQKQTNPTNQSSFSFAFTDFRFTCGVL